MTTKKGPAAQKPGKRVNKKATKTETVRVFTADELTHSPIVITDGSLSVEFDGRVYSHLGSGRHDSLGLRLDDVVVTTPRGGHTCRTFTGTDVHRITAHAMLGNLPTEIIIVGAKVPSLASVSPTIEFTRDTQFMENGFRPKFPFGRRFGNRDVRISKFTIRNLRTGEVHDCPFAVGGRFEYTINDGHAV